MKALLILLLGFGLVLPGLSGTTNEATTASAEPLVARTYKIRADAFVRNLKKLETPKSGESDQDLLVRFFREQRIEIQKPAAVFLDGKQGTLLVRTTQASQDQIENLIDKIVNTK